MSRQHVMHLRKIRERLHLLPDAEMATDLSDILEWMDNPPDPQVWLEEFPRVRVRLAFWMGEVERWVSHAEIDLDQIAGKLDIQIRSKAKEDGGKTTEDGVKNQVRSHDDYVRQAKVHTALQGVLLFLRGVRDAWNPDLLVQGSVNWRRQGETR